MLAAGRPAWSVTKKNRALSKARRTAWPREEKSAFCGQCGAKNKRGVKFCGDCGAPML
ncbi:MAG: zinc ribbon domain-containing protein [Peptococcaceae bacterium]|nr:zinc ribbon domain-containing protein [Peptococcaceae bacterium]